MDANNSVYFRKGSALSPRRIFFLVVGVVVGVELAIMIWIELLIEISDPLEVVVDPLLLTAVVVPVLYFLLYRPVSRAMDDLRSYTEALRYSEQKYSAVVNSSPSGIFILRDGKIVFGNQKLAQILGLDLDALLGRDLVSLIVEEDRFRLVPKVLEEPVEVSDPKDVEVRVARTPGDVRWVNIHTASLTYRDECSVLGMMQDVTERKQFEEELRSLSARRLTVEEDERGRLARELHDGVGQSLSGIKFFIEHTLAQSSFSNERRSSMEQLQTLVPRIQDTIDEVRTMAMALRPSTLDDLGLSSTVRWFLRELGESCPHLTIESHLMVQDEDVPESRAIVIYRTLQEAMNNAAKYCGTCHVLVKLLRTEGELQLSVEDDGMGFQPLEVLGRDAQERGYGLASMRERVELSGGTFRLEAAPGTGTRVQASWPLRELKN